MSGDAPERFMALVARLEREDPLLTPIQAGLLAAAGLDLAGAAAPSPACSVSPTHWSCANSPR